MTPGRIFRIVLLATLALDLVALAVLHLPPGSRALGLGRWLVCIAAAYAGGRAGLPLVRATAATAGGAMAATLLSMLVLVATGSAAAAGYGPTSVYAFLLATLAIGVVAGAAGAAAGHLPRKRARAG